MSIANEGPRTDAERITHTTDEFLPPVIGIYADAPGAGKSTVARMLGEWYYVRRPFAAPVKRMAEEFLVAMGYPRLEAQGDIAYKKEKPLSLVYGLSPRHILRTLGTEWGRDCIHPDVWVDAWKVSLSHTEHAVADDVRFPNEVHAIRALGGVVWYVERPGATGDTAHRSEGALSNITPDAVLLNNGTLEMLQWQVRARLEGACVRRMLAKRGMSVT